MLEQLLRSLGKKRTTKTTRRPAGFRPQVEQLESRELMSATFGSTKNYIAPAGPTSVAIGDFNGDGKNDVAMTSYTDGAVSIRLNNGTNGSGTPSFLVAVVKNTAGGVGARSAVVADFNGDGKLDIASANYLNNSVSILLNTTAPGASTVSFADHQTFASGNGTYELAVGDFNGDGRPDLAISNILDDTITVRRNTTAAGSSTVSFANTQTFATGTDPRSLTVGDFNLDGRTDLVVANSTGNTVSVLFNNTGAGSIAFASQQTFTTGGAPCEVAVGDFNGDGRPDLAVANATSDTVSVLLNTYTTGAATPVFAGQHTYSVGNYAESIVAADIDGDGRCDLITANYSDDSASVLHNQTPIGATSPTFASQSTYTMGDQPDHIVVADMNGDGKKDFVTANYADNTFSIRLNETPTLSVSTSVPVMVVPGHGVWQYNRASNTWVQLTTTDASLLVSNSAGTIVGNFAGAGLWRYTPTTGWTSLGTGDATALTVDTNGTIVANFAGYGLYRYQSAFGWQSMGTANATILTMDALGNIYANFTGYGVWKFRATTGWQQLNAVDANILAVNAGGDLVANFAGYGVGLYKAYTGWTSLSQVNASALAIDKIGNVSATFQGYGVNQYRQSTGWAQLHAADAKFIGTDEAGNLFGEFTGYGVIGYTATKGWAQLGTADVSKLFVA